MKSIKKIKQYAELLKNSGGIGDDWSPQIADAIQALWKDAGVLKAYERRDKDYQLNDSAK